LRRRTLVQGLPNRLPESSAESLTGYTCPDCHGAIELVIDDEGIPPLFRCRIGHTFTATEMMMGREQRVEHLLWTTLTALEELGALLADLDRLDDPTTTHERYTARIEHVRRQINALHAILAENRPTVLEQHAVSEPTGDA